MTMECYICGKKMRKGKIQFKGIKLEGWLCECGEKIVPSREVIKYEILTGKRKSDVRKVTTMGNSLVISIPREYLHDLHLKKGSKLVFLKEKDHLKLLPISLLGIH